MVQPGMAMNVKNMEASCGDAAVLVGESKMSDLEALWHTQFIDGLIGYLDVRAWALGKMQNNPAGGQLIDFRMYHYLYFTNLFGAIDWVRDFVQNKADQQAFDEILRRGFPVSGDLEYARELRNSIVHRGLDPVMQGTQHGNFVFAVSPPTVHSRNSRVGNHSYVCSSPLLVELALTCNQASNAAIHATLEREGLLEPVVRQLDQTDTLEAIKSSSHMPDWAKAMAVGGLAEMDFEAMAANLAQARTRQLRTLLGGT